MNNLIQFRKTIAMATTVIALNATQAHGHSDDYFDAIPSPHGGQIRMAGPYHFELSLTGQTITVYVTDHADRPIATTGAKGQLEITVGDNNTLVELTPNGENTFKASWSGTPTPTLIAKLTVKFGNEKSQKAKFTPFAKKK
jgi:hypothetical protein